MQRYPLSWPQGWKRSEASRLRRAQFSKGTCVGTPGAPDNRKAQRDLTVTDGTQRILRELRLLGADPQEIVISTNVRVRLDGLPRSGEREPADGGAAVYWRDTTMGNVPRCMAVDHYDRVADNLAAIAATLDAMRSIERHGGAQILARAFTGFDALPAPGQTTSPWRQVLGLKPNEASLRAAEEAYRRLRSQHHPDKGGGGDAFGAVQSAWEQAQVELGS